jgi:cell wall-associated NlpC family hydrolase
VQTGAAQDPLTQSSIAMSLTSFMTSFARIREGLVRAAVRYLVQPVKDWSPEPSADPHLLAAVLDPGDVLLTDGNTRCAALVKRLTGSTWSHVSIYVGPLEQAPDPLCIVEADIAAGVRPIRLSELNARRVRVLRPTALNDDERHHLAAWVVSRIGSDYDLAHAWSLARRAVGRRLPALLRSLPTSMAKSATRFICSTLVARAFLLVGYPIIGVDVPSSSNRTFDQVNVMPADFERASLFTVVWPAHPPGDACLVVTVGSADCPTER